MDQKLCMKLGMGLVIGLLLIWCILSFSKSEKYCDLVGQLEGYRERYTEGNPEFDPRRDVISDVNCLCKGKYADKLCVSREGLRQRYADCDYDTKNYSGVV